MTSESSGREAFVWVWLPGRHEAVVAGRLAPTPAGLQFNYGRSYLERLDRIALYLPELPLEPGLLALPTAAGTKAVGSATRWCRR